MKVFVQKVTQLNLRDHDSCVLLKALNFGYIEWATLNKRTIVRTDYLVMKKHIS